MSTVFFEFMRFLNRVASLAWLCI